MEDNSDVDMSVMDSESCSVAEEGVSNVHVSKSSRSRKRTPRASQKEFDALKCEFQSMNSKLEAFMTAFQQPQFLQPVNVPNSSDLPNENDVNHINVTSGERSGQGATNISDCVDNVETTLCVGPDVDTLSLQPGQQERQNLLGLSDDEQSNTNSDSCIVVPPEEGGGERFTKYSASTAQLLSDLFGEDAMTSLKSKSGMELDDSQVDILKGSWRSDDPSKISAYREAYKSSFPISDKSEDMLKVPSLDEIVDSLLIKRFGNRAVTKSQSLYTQPLKSLEKIAFQGQCAARMGIIVNLYVQRALGSLLTVLQDKTVNIDAAIQCVRDIFVMSSKSLDQVARSGSFHHLVRRRAALYDTGLIDLKDIKGHAWDLPLSHEGVFGSGLEKKLKDRQEINKQLSDLLPEVNQKRKFTSSDRSGQNQWKKPRYNSGTDRYPSGQAGGRQFGKPLGGYTIPKIPNRPKSRPSATVSSFRSNQ